MRSTAAITERLLRCFRAAVAAATMLILVPFAGAQCTPTMPVETRTSSNPNACGDSLDNDCDGQIDLSDGSCRVEVRFAVGGALQYDACADGYDNDDDGLTDGVDDNCRVETRWGFNAVSWYNACSDGYDNDQDGYTDGTAWAAPDDKTQDPNGMTQDPDCRGEFYCADLFDNDGDGRRDLVPGSEDNDCRCLQQATGLDNCTANDFTIAYNVNPADVSDGCINTSDKVTVSSFKATATAHSPNRYDLGLWVAVEGTSAYNGSKCFRQIFVPSRVYAGLPTDPIPTSLTLDFTPPLSYAPIMEPAGDQDRCGDFENNQTQSLLYPMPVTLPCNDVVLPSGYVDVGQCGSWDNNTQFSYCYAVDKSIPNNKAKCQCQTSDASGLPGPNVRLQCYYSLWSYTNGSTIGPTLDAGETAIFSLEYTNDLWNSTTNLPSCLPQPTGVTTAPNLLPDNLRTRCGTASFVRFTVSYAENALTYGVFRYWNGTSEVDVPACTTPALAPTTYSSHYTALCNDTTNRRLIFAPQDTQANNTLGVISPVPRTGGQPTVIGLGFRYKLNSTPPLPPTNFTTQFLADAWWDGDINTAAPLDSSVGLTEACDLSGAIKQMCDACNCSTGFGTTPVTLAAAGAIRDGNGVQFSWATATEVGTVGFNIYGKTAVGWQRLNREIVPAVGGGIDPQSYQITLDVEPGVTEFYIEDVESDGTASPHPSFRAEKGEGLLRGSEVDGGGGGVPRGSADQGHS